MIPATITIMISGLSVESTVEVKRNDLGRTEYVLTCTCGGLTKSSAICPPADVSYATEQLAYDVDQARHALAAEAAGEVYQDLVSTTILGAAAGAQEPVTEPTVVRPAKVV